MADWLENIPEAAREFIDGRRVDEVECLIAVMAGLVIFVEERRRDAAGSSAVFTMTAGALCVESGLARHFDSGQIRRFHGDHRRALWR